MSVLSDRTIRDLCTGDTPLISPFIGESIREVESGSKIPSYGLSSYGYDIRLEPGFELMKENFDGVIDPCKPSDEMYERVEGEACIIPPHGYLLANTVEYFRIPNNVTTMCLTKSTYARLGIMINVTPLEAGWEGQLVVEIANLTPHPVLITSNVGIAQVVFLRGDLPCETSYADRKGKYQGQTGITHAKV